jgi:hypothetical protein
VNVPSDVSPCQVGRAKVYYLIFNYFTESMALGGGDNERHRSEQWVPHEASTDSICSCNCFGIQSEYLHFISFFCEAKMYCENI